MPNLRHSTLIFCALLKKNYQVISITRLHVPRCLRSDQLWFSSTPMVFFLHHLPWRVSGWWKPSFFSERDAQPAMSMSASFLTVFDLILYHAILYRIVVYHIILSYAKLSSQLLIARYHIFSTLHAIGWHKSRCYLLHVTDWLTHYSISHVAITTRRMRLAPQMCTR